jgi:hypothetical protein
MNMTVALAELVHFLDSSLRIAEIPDDPSAINGLQLWAADGSDDEQAAGIALSRHQPYLRALIEDGPQGGGRRGGQLWLEAVIPEPERTLQTCQIARLGQAWRPPGRHHPPRDRRPRRRRSDSESDKLTQGRPCRTIIS